MKPIAPASSSVPADRETPFLGAGTTLTLLLLINLFNYLDRQVLAAAVSPIKEAFFGHSAAPGAVGSDSLTGMLSWFQSRLGFKPEDARGPRDPRRLGNATGCLFIEMTAAHEKHYVRGLWSRSRMRLMTPEERFERIERQLEFLAANQAQHDARMAEHSKQLIENSRQITENSRQIAQLADLTLRIGRIVEGQAQRMDTLTQHMETLAQRMDELAESQRHTDERLNTLINVVERYFSNGHQ